MNALTATAARSDLYQLIDRVNLESEPVLITGRRANAVLIGEEDWRAIQETMALESVPGFVESVKRAQADSWDEAVDELPW